MRQRLAYIALFALSLPGIYWGYNLVSAWPRHFLDEGWDDYLGVAFALILATIALYGMVSGRPFGRLPLIVKILTYVGAAIGSFFMAVFFLIVLTIILI